MDSEVLNDQIIQILEPNSMYYNAEKDDSTRYYIGPEAIEALGYLMTTIVLPILTNLISDELKEKLKLHRKSLRAAPVKELNEALSQASQAPAPNTNARRAAAAAAAAVLFSNGWPQSVAERDADEIVDKLTQTVWVAPK